ncbi:MAG: outer-membrane lipoprotein carrier protein LolA [Hyphomicrobiaceae bacterium]|nr:outer-membrane lipoprotein carrier protein LolA [Hyphomicrobiaceae bacterium]
MKYFRIRLNSLALRIQSSRSGLLSILLALGFIPCAQFTKAISSDPVGGAWQSQVDTEDNAGQKLSLTPEQIIVVKIVETYFNELTNLQGRFVQVDPDMQITKGRFFVQKPGRFRFDYSAPSRKVIISDGRFLAIQDLDLRNEDVYELSSTPFRILLRNNVDLLKDAHIAEIFSSESQISIKISDKNSVSTGSIKVIVGLQPEAHLVGWTTTDIQGRSTNISLSDLSVPKVINGDLFKRKALFRDAANTNAR